MMMSILDSIRTSCIVQVLSIVQLIKKDSFESTFDGEAPPAPPLLTEAGKPPSPWFVDDRHHALDDDAYG